MDESIHNFHATDAAISHVGNVLLNELRRGLSTIGFEAVVEDSFGVLAIRVADRDHVGTAYIEFKEGEIRARIVLLRDRTGEQQLAPTAETYPSVEAA